MCGFFPRVGRSCAFLLPCRREGQAREIYLVIAVIDDGVFDISDNLITPTPSSFPRFG